MTIALPCCQDRISPVLDTAGRLLVVNRRHGREVSPRKMVVLPQRAEDRARAIAALGVDILLCAAVSETLRRALETCGVRVTQHVCGEAEAVLRAFCGGHVRCREFRMPGCGRGCCQGRHPVAPASQFERKIKIKCKL